MDYGKLFGRAWEITWRWKILWLLGFLAALGRGGSGGGGNMNYVTGRGSGPMGLDILPGIVGLLGILVCFALVVGVALWVVSVIARGGLIAGVQQVEEQGETSFGSAWRVGVERFWALFGVGVLTSIPVFVAVLALLGFALVFGLGVAATAEYSDAAGAVAFIAPVLLCGIPFVCLLVIVGAVLGQIRIYAERAAVLEEMGWIDAFKRSWEVLQQNVAPTVVLWLAFLVIGMLIGLVILGLLFAVAVPFIPLAAAGSERSGLGPWILFPMLCGGVVMFVLTAAVNSVVETFSSATWTLAYRELTGRGNP